MQRKTLLNNLKQARTWVNKQTKKPSKRTLTASQDKAEDICVGCLDILDYIYEGYPAWVTRKSTLDKVRTNFHTALGRKALNNLIDLTEAVISVHTWQNDIPVGCLPHQTPRHTLTALQKAKMQEGRKAAKEQQEQILAKVTTRN